MTRARLVLFALVLAAWPVRADNYYDYTWLHPTPSAFTTQAGVSMIPFRAVWEWAGAKLTVADGWVVATGPGEKDETKIQVGSAQAMIGGQPVALPAAPIVWGGTTFVPGALLKLGLKADLRWVPAASQLLWTLNGKKAALSVAAARLPVSLAQVDMTPDQGMSALVGEPGGKQDDIDRELAREISGLGSGSGTTRGSRGASAGRSGRARRGGAGRSAH